MQNTRQDNKKHIPTHARAHARTRTHAFSLMLYNLLIIQFFAKLYKKCQRLYDIVNKNESKPAKYGRHTLRIFIKTVIMLELR